MTGDPVDGFFADDTEVWNTHVNLMLSMEKSYLDPANFCICCHSRVTEEEITLGPGEYDSRNE